MKRESTRLGQGRPLGRRVGMVLAGTMLLGHAAQGQVITDGSIGGLAATLQGPDISIPAELGERRGGNLFHSFSRFDLSFGEQATFSGPADVQHVLARVTGGTPSQINGVLKCDIPGANLYFVNPAGVLFHENARIEVDGAFVVSTADVVRLGNDAGRFDAASADATVLATAPPAGFGFLPTADAGRGAVRLVGATLAVNDGRALSVIARDVRVEGGRLVAGGGRMNVLAAGRGAAEAELDAFDPASAVALTPTAAAAAANALGTIELLDREVLDGERVQSSIVTNGDAPKGVFVIGDSLTLSGFSFIDSRNSGDADAAPVVLRAASRVSLSPGRVASTTEFGTGAAGGVEVETGELEITASGFLSAFTRGRGRGGDIDATVGRLEIDGGDLPVLTGFSVQAQSRNPGGGAGGAIRVNASAVELTRGGVISGLTRGQGAGGAITVNADTIRMERGDTGTVDTGINSTTESTAAGAGAGGEIILQAGSLQLGGGARIAASTAGSGSGGIINLSADDLLITGGASIESASGGTGAAGAITASATRDLIISDRGVVSVQADGAGGGDILLRAGRRVDLTDALITGKALSEGNVTVQAGQRVFLERSRLTAEATENGGKILIDPELVILRDSEINGLAGGTPLDVQIRADAFLTSQSVIKTDVPVNLPDTDIAAGLVRLPMPSLDRAAVLQPVCGLRFSPSTSVDTFVITGRVGAPIAPGGWSPSFAPPQR